MPHIGAIADDICIVRSLKTDAINHDPAHTFMNTGTTISGRPAMGSWVHYGLGCEADDLPGFCVLTSNGRFGQSQPIAARQWHSGFLPSRFQGVEFHSAGDPVLYVRSPAGISSGRQRDFVDAVEALNSLRNAAAPDPDRLGGRRDRPDQHLGTRTGEHRAAVVLGDPVAVVAELVGQPGKVERVVEGLRAGRAFGDRRLVENREKHCYRC